MQCASQVFYTILRSFSAAKMARLIQEISNLTTDEIANIYTVFLMSGYNINRANQIYAELFPLKPRPEPHIYCICYFAYHPEENASTVLRQCNGL